MSATYEKPDQYGITHTFCGRCHNELDDTDYRRVEHALEDCIIYLGNEVLRLRYLAERQVSPG